MNWSPVGFTVTLDGATFSPDTPRAILADKYQEMGDDVTADLLRGPEDLTQWLDGTLRVYDPTETIKMATANGWDIPRSTIYRMLKMTPPEADTVD